MRKSPHRNLLQAAYDCIVGDRLTATRWPLGFGKTMEKPDSPIVITVEGGVVQEVLAADRGVTYMIVDYDVEGVPVDDLVALQGVSAMIKPATIATFNPGFVGQVQKAILRLAATEPHRHWANTLNAPTVSCT